jgi:hypothetical protein
MRHPAMHHVVLRATSLAYLDIGVKMCWGASQVVAALAKAAKEPKAPLDAMFADVYAKLPWHLAEQRDEVAAHVARHPGACPDIPAN